MIRGKREARDFGHERGQGLVELALVAPILMLILFGAIQFALIFERQIGITNAVREAARRTAALAAPDLGTAQLNAMFAYTELQTLLGNSQSHEASRDNIVVCVVNPTANASDPAGNLNVVVRITESYRHPVFLPIVDLILDGIDGVTDQSLAASTSTEFHVEQTGISNNVGTGGVVRWNGSAMTIAPSCTP